MSLRTKLLAAVVGLNGVILLLALYLLLRSGADTVPIPSRQVVADLVALGGVAAASPDERARDQALARIDELEASGLVTDVYVIEDRANPDHPGFCVWEAHAWLDVDGPGAELEVGPRRREAERAFARARRDREHGTFLGEDSVAVVLPVTLGVGAGRGLVAFHGVLPDQRSGVRVVYLVMVVGVILLTAVSFWLVSRLVVRPLDRLTEAADRIARGDYRVRLELRGTNDEFDRTTAAFNRMAGEIGEYQSHLEDRVLTALKRMQKAEQHLAIAQRLAATGKLASGVAHEINNPLGGMKNAVRSLARGDLGEEKTGIYLDLIADGLGRVEETVKKFLSFTPRRVEPRPTDLGEVAHKAAELARHRLERHGVTFEEQLPAPGQAMVFGDPHELQQVALNLLLNAADAAAANPGGQVTLRIEDRGDEVVLEVGDNGVGLSPEDQDRCFDMFFTTKDVGEGTGLGLAVAHTIVTNHGGRIELESAAGEGATFRVVLPAERRDEGDAAAK